MRAKGNSRIGTALIYVLACLVGLAGCSALSPGTVYDDDRALAGADRVAVAVYMGGSGGEGRYEVKATAQNGSQTVWRYEEKVVAGEDPEPVSIAYNLSTADSSSGRVKLVLVRPDNSLVILGELSGAGDETDGSASFIPEKGVYRLKLVADGASYSAVLDANAGKWE